ncbi:DUF1800 domain-containing protein [Ramlibacter humi]|uniref:DUF1800 domain-containing protein n=1 Tax=Ramlibacter humi TaxID=2530451 RepID=A0A4Z0CBL5_9BURK|nr:DUF1800 domain-containing protein [Ramlibacter humi]TFZ08282.1 DUF1800 domain-containing protein [Ramlibacter humi]
MLSATALNRFGLGARPDEPVPPDAQRWLLQQLDRFETRPPALASQPASGAALAQYLAERREVRQAADETARVAAQQVYRRGSREAYVAAVGARTSAALQSNTPFAERLVHFWSNHFAVSIDKLPVVGLAGAYEADAIRPHVLGRFHDLLLAAVRHPAMLLYLDQAASIGPDSPAGRRLAQRDETRRRGLNENLAREVLELHTLGVRSGYTQADVTEFARALTGWSVAGLDTPPGAASPEGFVFRPMVHEPGTRTLLGRRYPEGGEEQALAVLRDLAASPATARHVAAKLARHFVADDPAPALVQRLSDTFLQTGGDLPSVYRALVTAPEAAAPVPSKFKSPWDWTLSALRGLGRRDIAPQQAVALFNQLAQPVWRPGSPAGWDDVAASWAAPDALVRRVELAQRIASQAGNAVDARDLARRLLPGTLGEATATQIARAESPGSALALLLVSPEFLRR